MKIIAYSGQEIEYPIYLINKLSEIEEKLTTSIAKYSSVVIFSDCFLEKLKAYKDVIFLFEKITSNLKIDLFCYPITPGKDSKNIKTLLKTSDWLINNKVQRDSLFVAIGGGVVGDLVGFLSSTYYRGVALLHIPTNIISMSDSSIGGKTAINTNNHVNTLGTYKHPVLTIMYSEFLSTLTDREFFSGFAEIIKISILKKGELIQKITEEEIPRNILKNRLKLLEILKLAIQYKIEFTNKDIRERSKRLYLNFGHTFGHPIESIQDLSTEEYYRHGEAVSLGMISALHLSDKLFGSNLTKGYIEILKKFNLPTKLSTEYIDQIGLKNKQLLLDQLVSITFTDKKGAKGLLRLILINDGKPIIYNTNDKNLIEYGFKKII